MKNTAFPMARRAALAFCIVLLWASWASARSSIWISSRDENACIVSAVFQYDDKLEAQIRRDNGLTNNIVQIDIHTKDPTELCKMLVMSQGKTRWMPLICLTGIRGNIYTGYLVLPEEFDIRQDIEIRLGERTVNARFTE